MEKMAVPIVVVIPLAKTIEGALPLLVKEGERFALRMVQANELNFMAYYRDIPHVFVFSFHNVAGRTQVKQLLEKMPDVPPLWRIIVISEDPRGAAAENWKQRGVHEFILGPILGRAFLLKLDRHYKKMSQQYEAAGSPKPPKTVLERPPGAVVAGKVDSATGQSYDFVVHGTMLGPNSFLFEKTTEEDFKKVMVSCDVPKMIDAEGQWVRNTELVGEGGEAVWDWVVSMKKEDKESGFRFIGERPVFDKESGQWVFSGKTPMFFHRGALPHAPHSPELPNAPNSNDENMVFGYSHKSGVIMYKGHVATESARILYVRFDDFSNSNLKYFQKKKTESNEKVAPPEPAKLKSGNEADDDLLKALADATRKKPPKS